MATIFRGRANGNSETPGLAPPPAPPRPAAAINCSLALWIEAEHYALRVALYPLFQAWLTKTGGAVAYEVWSDGDALACDCPSWTYSKRDQWGRKSCKHCRALAAVGLFEERQ